MGARPAARVAGCVVSIVIDKDVRVRFGPARDQDPRPTCMAFAVSDAHAAARGAWTPLSVEWAYYHALKHDGSKPHAGVTMTGMLTALRSDGQPEESAWPYIAEKFTDMSGWVPPPANPIYRRESTQRPASIDTIRQCLDTGEALVLTLSISRSFFRPKLGGVIDATEVLEPRRIHAVIAVGYGHRQQETFILVRNSWGESWGIEGYAWASEIYLKPRLLRAATMAGEP